MRPKKYYEAPVGPKNYDDVHDPCLKVKSINTRVDIIKEAIQASIIQGTQERLIKPSPKCGPRPRASSMGLNSIDTFYQRLKADF